MRKITLATFFLTGLFANAKEYGVPEKYESFMNGYEYEYKNPNCSVHWHIRSATFLFDGRPESECNKISAHKMTEDAIKSINYVKSKGDYEDFSDYYYQMELAKKPYSIQQANQDAVSIWVMGCNNYKEGKITQDFPSAYRIGKISNLYPRIKEHIVIHLYDHGWQTSLANKAHLICGEIGYYTTSSFLDNLGDIRKK